MTINKKEVRKLVHEKGKRTSKSFFLALDIHVREIVEKACKQFNANKKTLDGTILTFVIGGKK
jgi:hypothetical protein